MIRATVYLWPHAKCDAGFGFGRLTVKTEDLEGDEKKRTDYFSWPMLPVTEEEARSGAWRAMSGEELFEKELNKRGQHYLAVELQTLEVKSYETFLADFEGGPFGDILAYRDLETLCYSADRFAVEKFRELKEVRCSHSVWLVLKAMGYPLVECAWLSITPHGLMRELLAPYSPSRLQASAQSPLSLPQNLKVASTVGNLQIDEPYRPALEELTRIRLYKKVFRREGQALERDFRLSHGEDYAELKLLSSIYRLSLYRPNEPTSLFAADLLNYFQLALRNEGKDQRRMHYLSCMRELQVYLKQNSSSVHVKMMLLNILLGVLTLGIANVVNYARVQRFTVFRDVSARTKFLKIEKQLKALKPVLESRFKAAPG